MAYHLVIKTSTDFKEAKTKLSDNLAVTKSPEKLREKLELRRQDAGESIVSIACDIKLIDTENIRTVIFSFSSIFE